MRILILCRTYPKPQEKNARVFVHARAKIYQNFGSKVQVFVPSKTTYTYNFEGIKVNEGSDEAYLSLLKDFAPEVVAIHSPTYKMSGNPVKMLDRTLKQAPVIMWIHGTEALVNAFHNYFAPWKVKAKLKNIIGAPLKIMMLRLLISKASAVVYVSEWMKNIAEQYLSFKHPYSFTIPNPIDISLFTCKGRDPQNRSKGIAVRGLDWKYGTDIAIQAYSNLEESRLTILGTGSLDAYMHNLAKKCQSNVSFLETPIEHNKMPEIYTEHSYFVAPSRTEAQGVAMCEAMGCGLPAIATNVGGIPEFVKNGVNGILVPPENPGALRKAVKHILTNEQINETLSENCVNFVKENLSHNKIYLREHQVFEICQNKS